MNKNKAKIKQELQESDKQAVFEYRCRRCNGIFDGCESGVNSAYMHLVNACYRVPSNNPPPSQVSFHECIKKSNEYAIGDLIGYRIEGN